MKENKEPGQESRLAKTSGKTVAVACPHCQGEQRVRPDSISVFCDHCHNPISIQAVLHPKVQASKSSGKTVLLFCPDCQFEQPVRPDGLSIFCRQCHKTINIQEALHPKARLEIKASEGRTVFCLRCNVELTASVKAQSIMCRKCGYRNDLQDYHVKNLLSQNLETYGNLNISAGGTVLNSTAKVKNAIIHGKFIGRLMALNEVVLKAGAIFQGGLTTETLIIESNVQCIIKKEFKAKNIVIAGVYHGNIRTNQYVLLKKSACFVGSLISKNVVLEDGASLFGELKIGSALSESVEVA